MGRGICIGRLRLVCGANVSWPFIYRPTTLINSRTTIRLGAIWPQILDLVVGIAYGFGPNGI